MKFVFHGPSENRGGSIIDAIWLKCSNLITGRLVQRGKGGDRARAEQTQQAHLNSALPEE